jgi:hypothetical protein
MAYAHYVHARRQNFLQEQRLFSGPFDSRAAAHDERDRLARLWPDLVLSVKSHRAKVLPILVPPPPDPVNVSYDLSKPDDRRAAARYIVDHGHLLGAAAAVSVWDEEYDVDVATPNLSAAVLIDGRSPIPAVRWHSPTRNLREVPGAWRAADFMAVYTRSVTFRPTSWPALFEALTAGILASIDGSAFDPQEGK